MRTPRSSSSRGSIGGSHRSRLDTQTRLKAAPSTGAGGLSQAQGNGQNHREEEEHRDQGQGHHQVKLQLGLGVSGRGAVAKIRQRLVEAVCEDQVQRGGGREGRLSPIAHSDQQALSGRVPVAQGARRAHLARAQPQAEESGLAGLQHVVGQPGVVSRVGVHRHHLGDQVAGLRGARHRVEERRAVGPQRRVQHPGRVVVAVAHQHAQAHVGAERGRALVAGLQRQLEGAQLLVVEGALREHRPALRAHRHVGRQRPRLQVAGHDGVGHLAVGPQVGVGGADLRDRGARRVVFCHVDHVGGLLENRRVVVDVCDDQGDTSIGGEGRLAPVGCSDGNVVFWSLLSI
ncbi:hypothetical protein MC885_008407 [Smutsia gigantea]|nr:hypothetical protein MC885_008407 [Smutsia gigantea]